MPRDVLFVGPVLSDCSWGRAARDYVRCFEQFANDVAVTHMDFGDPPLGPEHPDYHWIVALNDNQVSNDILVQMAFPHMLYKDCRFKQNVGIFLEESHEKHMYDNITLMDKILVPSRAEKTAVVLGSDIDQRNIEYTGLPSIEIPFGKEYPSVRDSLPINSDTFMFYTIGPDTERKNLDCLIKAYLTEFSSQDNVGLLIKTDGPIEDKIQHIKNVMRAKVDSEYPPIFTLKDRLTEDQLNGLHAGLDCYVSTSRGESWCYPAADAAAFGNNLVIPNYMFGYGDFADLHGTTEGTRYIQSSVENCFVERPPTAIHYSAQSHWAEPNSRHTGEQMRNALNREWKTNKPNIFTKKFIAQRIQQCLES